MKPVRTLLQRVTGTVTGLVIPMWVRLSIIAALVLLALWVFA